MKDGFLHVPGVIRAHLVRRARRAINHSLGAGFDHRNVVRMNARSFREELVEDPRLLRLATNPHAWSRVRSLLGERRVERPTDCQLAHAASPNHSGETIGQAAQVTIEAANVPIQVPKESQNQGR